VRHFHVLGALMLTACALPGASGGSTFMSAMHPTQDFCESRGMTLDATTKQCVAPPKTSTSTSTPTPSPPADAVTGSLPQDAPAQKAAPAQSSPAAAKPAPVAALRPPPQPPAPQPQQRQSVDLKVPIEPEAAIHPQFAGNFDLMFELAHFVRASGYRCDSISALEPRPGGYQLVCDRSNYKYAIQNKDGRSIVTVE